VDDAVPFLSCVSGSERGRPFSGSAGAVSELRIRQ